MGELTNKNSTFPQRLVRAARDIGEFSAGVPLGFLGAIIPGIGYLAGTFALNGYLEQDIRYRDEDSDAYRARLLDNERHRSFGRGMNTGIVIGLIGQTAMWISVSR